MREIIVEYISNLSNESNLDPSLNLFENGYISSLDILDIICFIEETFNIAIGDDELGMDNFSTIDRMVSYIEKKQPQK